MSYTTWAPSWQTTAPPKDPTLYRIDLTLASSDGLHPIVLQRQSEEVLMKRPKDQSDLFASVVGQGDCCTGDFNADGSLASVGGGFDNAPAIVSPIIAVDPVAESQLLGPSATFLAPLATLTDRANLTVSAFDRSLIPSDLPHAQDDLQTAEEYGASRPVVPLVVSDRIYAPLTMTISVTQLGQPLRAMPPTADQDPGSVIAAAQAAAGSGQTAVGTKSVDLSTQLVPFIPPPAALTLPGSGPPADQGILLTTPSLSQVSVTSRPTYSTKLSIGTGSLPTYQIAFQGISDPSGNLIQYSPSSKPGGNPATTGAEPAYRSFTDLPLATGVTTLANSYDQPFFMLPIGRFDLSTLRLPTNPLTYVPVGAYAPPDTTLVAGPDGARLAAPRAMNPTLNPSGLIAVPPLAITDMAAAELLRGKSPIDAIRVRVAGLSGYDTVGQAKVERVASSIASLGLDVDVVAGSSPQPVDIYVPSYFVNQSPPTDLGYVSQDWTTLGAASRVESGLTMASFLLLGLGLLMASTLAVALEASRAAVRLREASILRTIGCSPWTTVRWMAGEAAVASAAVAMIGVAAWRLGGGQSFLGLASGLILATGLGSSAVTGVLLARRGPGSAPAGDVWGGLRSQGWAAVRGPVSYGFRAFIARPIRSAAIAVSLGLSSAAAGIGGVVVVTAIARAGPTRLAGAVSELVQPSQAALLALVMSTGIVLTFLLLRRDVVDRSDELATLAASGWTPGERRRVLRIQRFGSFVPAAVLATIIAWPLAVPLALASPPLVVSVALVVAGVTLALGQLSSERAASLS